MSKNFYGKIVFASKQKIKKQKSLVKVLFIINMDCETQMDFVFYITNILYVYLTNKFHLCRQGHCKLESNKTQQVCTPDIWPHLRI